VIREYLNPQGSGVEFRIASFPKRVGWFRKGNIVFLASGEFCTRAIGSPAFSYITKWSAKHDVSYTSRRPKDGEHSPPILF